MATDAEELLYETEDLIEDWLCELDATWASTIAEAEARAAATVGSARLEAEQVLAAARAEALQARAEAQQATARARDEAAEIVTLARLEADTIIAEANATAGEHEDVIRALTTAEREAAGEELVSLREAVRRLRAELSNLVDAAFDALPAVEATAEAIDRAIGEEEEPELVLAGPTPKRRFFSRLFHR